METILTVIGAAALTRWIMLAIDKMEGQQR